MKLWLLIPFLCSTAAWAELKWERLRADVSVGADEKSVETDFKFTNAGPAPVVIESLKSSCGCVVPTLEKKAYAPGESGEIKARFDVGQRRGVQNKQVAAKLQGRNEPFILTLSVTIIEAIKVTSGVVLWELGEKNQPKEISVALRPGQNIRSFTVTSSDPNMQTQVETVKEGESYTVRVVPQTTQKSGLAVLTIKAETAQGAKTVRAYAQIKPGAR